MAPTALALLAASFALLTVGVHSVYPVECCGEGDCRPVPCANFSEESIHGTGLPVVVYTDSGRRFYSRRSDILPSPDGNCHACFWRGTLSMRCVFWPRETS